MNAQRLSPDLKDLWSQLHAEKKVPDKREIMKEIIKKLPLDSSKEEVIDTALVECTVWPILFELGMSIVMEASEYVREAFRKRLIECGAVFQVMRLVARMNRSLSRDEIVMLGNRYSGGLMCDEVKQLLDYAERIDGITPLDLLRIRKQFGVQNQG